MQVQNHDSQGGAGITYIQTDYNKVVLFFHGLGDTADGWADHISGLGFSKTKLIFPTAPLRSISLNSGHKMPGWSDIHALDQSSEEDKIGLEESAARINKIVKAEIDNGISADKIIVGGFSQGGALALHVGLRSPYSLGGCVALSTWLPLSHEYPEALSTSATSLPIFQAHGTSDSVVRFDWGTSSHNIIKTLITNPAPVFKSIQNMGHTSHPQEMAAVYAFLNERLGRP